MTGLVADVESALALGLIGDGPCVIPRAVVMRNGEMRNAEG